MEFYFKEVEGKMHLYREKTLFDEDLGELFFDAQKRLKTDRRREENFVLKDISGTFSQGKKYSIESTEGLKGILEKKSFSKKYVLKQED